MSIFSINDNSNYNSILSQAKANKESKENSKISFANAFLKQNASKLNEIQSANFTPKRNRFCLYYFNIYLG
ncbi:hypothetical protein RC42_04155 [Campylobacter jejuni]|nr:hypothetical protein [Campylobacter jejuni]ALW60366.1 hypothetical protein RC42_04155 [Campylobacter jejuni]